MTKGGKMQRWWQEQSRPLYRRELRGERVGLETETRLLKEDGTVLVMGNNYRKRELDWLCHFQMSILAELSKQISKIETQN